mgnify:CR=1 FL=1
MANLRKGSRGDEVKELQTLLNSSGNYGLREDGVFGDKTLAAVRDYQKRNGLTTDGIAGANTLGKLRGNSSPSTSANPAATSPGATAVATAPAQKSYADQVNEALQQILNRQPLNYNYNGDPLYQMYRDAALQNSQTASKDVLARAAALTGGYGNSYADTAAQQTAQAQMAQLTEKIPELAQVAQTRYDAETDRLKGNLGILSDLENQEYTRKFNEDQRDYERQQYADQLEREKDNDAWNRRLAMAQLAAQYGDTSGLEKLGIKTGSIKAGSSSGSGGTNDELSKWAYGEYYKYIQADPPLDETKAQYWAQTLLNAYTDGIITEDQAKMLAAQTDILNNAFWSLFERYDSGKQHSAAQKKATEDVLKGLNIGGNSALAALYKRIRELNGLG